MFAEDKDGLTTMRELVTPENPKTAKQMNVRGAFKKSGGSFKNMENSDALAWDAFGKLQKDRNGKPMSGIAAYNQLSIKFRLVNPGQTPPVTPPTASYVGNDLSMAVTASTGALTFSATGANDADSVTELLIQPLASGNRKPQAEAYETAGYYQYIQPNPNAFTVDVPAGYYAAGYRYVNKVTGQMTDIVPLQVYGVALSVAQGGAEAKPQARKKAA